MFYKTTTEAMLKLNDRGLVLGEAIHQAIDSKMSNYSLWVKRSIKYADLNLGKDFFTYLLKSTGGRQKMQYEFTLEAAKEICLVERNNKGKQIRRWLIELDKQKQDLELITPKQAALAYEYINFFKYVENQKDAYLQHQKCYVDSTPKSKYIYAEFAKYRDGIVGWDKQKVDEAIKKYLTTHSGHNFTKLMKKSMSDKLSVMDVNEAIRVSVLDLLYSKGTNTELANKFANMVKNVSNEMDVLVYKKNETNLFQNKENLNLKAIQ